MPQKKPVRLGLAFATGRKSFRKILNSYAHSWLETGVPDGSDPVSLRLFVAYDTEYSHTKSTDYTNLPQEVVDIFDGISFFGIKSAFSSLDRYLRDGTITEKEGQLLFGGGYAGKRNILLFAAIDSGTDYLLFLDDDEYPVAVTNRKGSCLWSGQPVMLEHLTHIPGADITHGHHCGYISPIPQIRFNEVLNEEAFRLFIEAISNDIVNWDTIRALMKNGGVTYADTEVLTAKAARPVEEIGGCKFISGSNLCLNLRDPLRSLPFYNPPGARGEDSFLSTLLHDRAVLKVPCYAFHDGFATYNHLLDGVLPIRLKAVTAASPAIVSRFHRACVGWVRYKPLLVYLTDRAHFESRMADARDKLRAVLPSVCGYFGTSSFMDVAEELEKYAKNAPRHARQFAVAQAAWARLVGAAGKRPVAE